jgi:hypothetical protein
MAHTIRYYIYIIPVWLIPKDTIFQFYRCSATLDKTSLNVITFSITELIIMTLSITIQKAVRCILLSVTI